MENKAQTKPPVVMPSSGSPKNTHLLPEVVKGWASFTPPLGVADVPYAVRLLIKFALQLSLSATPNPRIRLFPKQFQKLQEAKKRSKYISEWADALCARYNATIEEIPTPAESADPKSKQKAQYQMIWFEEAADFKLHQEAEKRKAEYEKISNILFPNKTTKKEAKL